MAKIKNLTSRDIQDISSRTKGTTLEKAFTYFKQENITSNNLIKELREDFSSEKCMLLDSENVNEEKQLKLNDLENKNNEIRAIFAVNMLNEGWDVLNLFDIVRLYDTRDGKWVYGKYKPGNTTLGEAQLIGRGARYFPFSIKATDDKYKRKYDKDLQNDLRVLEELHYHSHNESRYISEIKTALIEEGMLDENEVEVELKLKKEFKDSPFYKHGLVYANEKKKRSFEKVRSIEDLGVRKKSVDFKILSGGGKQTTVFESGESVVREGVSRTGKEIKLKDIESHIVRNVLAKNEFFNFSSLKKYFPEISSIREFVKEEKYLAGFKINFLMEKYTPAISNEDKFNAVLKLINEIEKQIKDNLTEYEGSEEFGASNVYEIFGDKKIKVKKDSERLNGQIEFLEDKDWYVFNANYGTSEEKAFVKLIDRQIEELRKKYKKVYLVRNERQLKLFNFKDGQAFEPDYLLFLVDKAGKEITYQLFLEPKGPQLVGSEKWKADFLEEIKEKFKDRVLEFSKSQKYKIIGLPFYNQETENDFKEKLMESLKV